MKLVPPATSTFSMALVFVLMNRFLVEFNVICENRYLLFVISLLVCIEFVMVK